MASRIEEKTEKIKDRLKALQTLESGTGRLRMSLYFAEMDRRRLNGKLPDKAIVPRLTDDELDQLLNSLNGNYETFRNQWNKYQRLLDAIVQVEKAFERLERVAEMMAFHLQGWELAEQMELAVNVALSQIPDKAKRTATATGIAKHIQLLAYSQSVDNDGLLVISPINDREKYDASTRIGATAISFKKAVSEFKAAVEATLYAMKKWGLYFDMSASRAYIKTFTKQAEKYNIAWTKHYEQPSMYSNGERQTPKELQESGQPLLYEPYRLLPFYDDIPASEQVKQIILKYYIGCEYEEENDTKQDDGKNEER